jgi:hypothetical protein
MDGRRLPGNYDDIAAQTAAVTGTGNEHIMPL